MVLSDKGEPLSTRWTSGLERGHSARERLPLGQGGRASLLVNLSIDEMAPQGEVIVKVGVDECEFLQDRICRNLSIARSRRRKERWLFSTRLFSRCPISCCLPRSRIAAG